MLTATAIFHWDQEGDTIILTPQVNLRELDYPLLETEAREVLSLVNGAPARNVVLDFQMTDYFGSTALGIFLALRKKACSLGGQMVLCNVSDHECELFQLTRLEPLWPVYPSREEALAVLRKEGPLFFPDKLAQGAKP